MLHLRQRWILPVCTAACLLLPAASQSGALQREKQYAIDKWLEKEMDKDPSTAGMRRSTQVAEAKWDAEMNRAYKKLLARLSGKQKAALQSAQRAWIAYRDAEFKLTGELYYSKQGTMYLPMHDSHRMEIVKHRAIELQDYDKLLDD